MIYPSHSSYPMQYACIGTFRFPAPLYFELASAIWRTHVDRLQLDRLQQQHDRLVDRLQQHDIPQQRIASGEPPW